MPKTVFFDVDTQLDFVYPAGAIYTAGAQTLVPNLTKLTQFAEANKIRIVSTADAHTENDVEFKVWKPHCVAGTAGQTKVHTTLLSSRATLTSDEGAFEKQKSELFEAEQVIVEKQKIDCFSNPNLKAFLSSLNADRFVVYGLLTEYCLGSAALGLLEFAKRVELVSDAMYSLDEAASKAVVDQFQSRGGRLTDAAAVVTG